jgi:hypothetical protein
MSDKATAWAWHQKGLNKIEKLLLLRLCDIADSNDFAEFSPVAVCDDCEITMRQYNKAIHKLANVIGLIGYEKSNYALTDHGGLDVIRHKYRLNWCIGGRV